MKTDGMKIDANPSSHEERITPREQDYPAWYLDVIEKADLAESSPVRGCMVIKPYGYAIWEGIQGDLDDKIKATGHKNAYFPLFIPKSFLQREATHVEGFAMECAIVTHHRLAKNEKGELVPTSPLEEELVVRPTSETIIMESFKRWIRSYRDLPLLINQWANVVRWEMRTRPFLRTLEFLWQEGHTAHATSEDAEDETRKMLDVYRSFAEETLALPVLVGRKSETEKFAGADHTYCIEAMMQDRKALQAGTSHHLGQNFAKAFEIEFLDKNQKRATAWTTSWGVSTRLIGGLIMAHADDDGLVLPPRVAPVHVVLIPIGKGEAERAKAVEALRRVEARLRATPYARGFVRVELDDRDNLRPGAKHFEWEKKGAPIRVECGPRDLANDQLVVATRFDKSKVTVSADAFMSGIAARLDAIQEGMFEKARLFRDAHSHRVDDWDAFRLFFTPRNDEKPEIHGGFARAHWCGDAKCEAEVKESLKVTIRCIELDAPEEPGSCIRCGGKSSKRVVFGKAY